MPGCRRYPCCKAAYHSVFFDLFDRNQDGSADREEVEATANESFERTWQSAQKDFDSAITRRDVDEAHRIWCRVSELWLYLIKGTDMENLMRNWP